MKKRISFAIVLVLIISMFAFAGCGGDQKTAEKSPYSGKWIATTAELMGISIPVKDAFEGDFYFEVKDGGKLVFTVDGDSGKGKWSVEGDQFTLSIEGEEMVGTIGENTITFKDMMGEEGLNVIFVKDGTDAMDLSS